jgi:hypothetical protein
LNHKAFGAPVVNGDLIEEKIVNELLTDTFIEKEYSKLSIDGWESRYIPRLLNTVWHEFIQDEIWQILKKWKNPKIDFKLLQRLVTVKIKEIKKELF